MKHLQKHKRPLIDNDDYFSSMSEEELFNYWMVCYPGGSGPISIMRTVCRLIEAVAKLRGIDVSHWPARCENLK